MADGINLVRSGELSMSHCRLSGQASFLSRCLIVVALLSSSGSAAGQTYGPGDSPGRAAYRTSSSWNNGPFYTAPHWDPWAARPKVSNDLPSSHAQLPPYSNQPRGSYAEYDPGPGRLYPYQQGFSPYSGYASWYQKTYGVVPDERNLSSAARAYFRSSPIPASPRYVAPAVTEALNPRIISPTAIPSTTRTTQSLIDPAQPRQVRPATSSPPRRARRITIYRQGLPVSR